MRKPWETKEWRGLPNVVALLGIVLLVLVSPSSAMSILSNKKIPRIDQWTISPKDGSLTGIVTGHPVLSDGDEITTSPISDPEAASKGKGTIVTTLSGTKYKLETPKKKRGPLSFFTGKKSEETPLLPSVPKAPIQRTKQNIRKNGGIPVIDNWKIDPSSGRLTGIVTGHPVLPDGDFISASPPLETNFQQGSIITTETGSTYKLKTPKRGVSSLPFRKPTPPSPEVTQEEIDEQLAKLEQNNINVLGAVAAVGVAGVVGLNVVNEPNGNPKFDITTPQNTIHRVAKRKEVASSSVVRSNSDDVHKREEEQAEKEKAAEKLRIERLQKEEAEKLERQQKKEREAALAERARIEKQRQLEAEAEKVRVAKAEAEKARLERLQHQKELERQRFLEEQETAKKAIEKARLEREEQRARREEYLQQRRENMEFRLEAAETAKKEAELRVAANEKAKAELRERRQELESLWDQRRQKQQEQAKEQQAKELLAKQEEAKQENPLDFIVKKGLASKESRDEKAAAETSKAMKEIEDISIRAKQLEERRKADEQFSVWKTIQSGVAGIATAGVTGAAGLVTSFELRRRLGDAVNDTLIPSDTDLVSGDEFGIKVSKTAGEPKPPTTKPPPKKVLASNITDKLKFVDEIDDLLAEVETVLAEVDGKTKKTSISTVMTQDALPTFPVYFSKSDESQGEDSFRKVGEEHFHSESSSIEPKGKMDSAGPLVGEDEDCESQSDPNTFESGNKNETMKAPMPTQSEGAEEDAQLLTPEDRLRELERLEAEMENVSVEVGDEIELSQIITIDDTVIEEDVMVAISEDAVLRDEARIRCDGGRIKATEETRVQAEEKARIKTKEEARLQAEEEARIKAEEEARLQAEEEAKIKAKEEARLQAEEEAKIKAKEEARLQAEEEARIKAEEEARLQAEEEAKIKAEEEARLQAEEEAKIKAKEEARLQAEEEAKIKAKEEARLQAEEEAKIKAKEEARLQAEEEAKIKAKEEARLQEEEEASIKAKAQARIQAEEEARIKAEEEARLQAEEEAKIKAKEEARLQAEEEARINAEEEARLQAEEEAKIKAKEEARLQAEEEAKIKAKEEARLQAEEEARIKAEEEARLQAEEEAKIRAEEEARLQAEEEAKIKAKEEARLQAEEEARIKAEEDVRLQAEEEAKIRAEEEARLRAEEEARRQAEEEARIRAEEEARLRAEDEAKLLAEEEVRIKAEMRIKTEEEIERRQVELEKARDYDSELEPVRRKLLEARLKMQYRDAAKERERAESERLAHELTVIEERKKKMVNEQAALFAERKNHEFRLEKARRKLLAERLKEQKLAFDVEMEKKVMKFEREVESSHREMLGSRLKIQKRNADLAKKTRIDQYNRLLERTREKMMKSRLVREVFVRMKERKRRAEEEARIKAEQKAAAKAKAEEEARIKAEQKVAAKAKAEEEANVAIAKANEAVAKAKKEAENQAAKAKAEEQARMKAEEEAAKANAKAAEEAANARFQEEARIRAEKEAAAATRAREEAKLLMKLELEAAAAKAKAEAEEEARMKLEQEAAIAKAKAKTEEEARIKLEKEVAVAKAKAEADEKARIKLEEEAIAARKTADAEHKAKVEAEKKAAAAIAKAKAEEEARIKLEKETADAQAKVEAREEARIKLEAEAAISKAKEEEEIQIKEKATTKAEEEARLKAEEEARVEAQQEEEKAKAEAEATRQMEEEAAAREEEARERAKEDAAAKMALLSPTQSKKETRMYELERLEREFGLNGSSAFMETDESASTLPGSGEYQTESYDVGLDSPTQEYSLNADALKKKYDSIAKEQSEVATRLQDLEMNGEQDAKRTESAVQSSAGDLQFLQDITKNGSKESEKPSYQDRFEDLAAQQAADKATKSDKLYSPTDKALANTTLLMKEVTGPSLENYNPREGYYSERDVLVRSGNTLSVPVRISTPGTIVEFSIKKKAYDFGFGISAFLEDGTVAKIKEMAPFRKKLETEKILVPAGSAPCTMQFKFTNNYSGLLEKVRLGYNIRVIPPSTETIQLGRRRRATAALDNLEARLSSQRKLLARSQIVVTELEREVTELQQLINDKNKKLESILIEEEHLQKVLESTIDTDQSTKKTSNQGKVHNSMKYFNDFT